MAVNTFTPSDGNVHPDFPDRRTLTGPFEIVDTLPPDPGSNSSLTRRSTLNSVQEPVKHNLRGTIAGARSTIAVPYGLCRMPGKTTWWHFTNQKWYFVHCFGERVSTPTKLVIDGVDYSLTAQTSTGMWRAAFGGGFYSVYNGDQDYVDQLLLSLGVDYTDTHNGYCYGVFVQDQNFLSSWPRVELVGQGQDAVYDPRLNSGAGGTAYTTNPALILADIIDRYTPLMLDWPSVEVAADYCDETVNGEKRSEFGFAFQRARKVEDWIAVLREYAYCYVINDGATVRFICDCARASVKSFGNNEIRLATTRWKKGDLNTTPANVEVEYFNATTGESGQVTAVEDTGNEIDFYNMPGFSSKQQAQLWAIRRYNKMTLRDLTGSLTVEAEGIEIDFGDRITVTDQRYSAISSKDVEVLDIAYPGPGLYQWQVIEYQPNAYTDTPQSQPALADTTLPDPFDYPDAPTFTVTYGTTNEGVTGDVQHWADVSWETPTDYPYITGWHILAGWGGKPSPSIEPEVLVDIIMPPETTTFRVYGADPLWGAGFNPNDYNFYLTALTTLRPNRVLQFTDLNDNLGSGVGADASNGVYHEFLELQDDPTPGPVNNVQVATVTGGVLVTWRYGRRPNYIMQFHVDIVNQTDGDTQTTILSDGLSVFVPDSVFAGDSGDTMRADVKVANRNITIYSSTVSSGTFTAP